MMMSPGLRKFALAVHLTLSVGWIGAVAAYMALDVAAATNQDPQTVHAAYLGMDSIVRFIIVPLAFASLLTGLVMSLGTKWGLFRHYWVLISLVLTTIATVVLLVETRVISSLADTAVDPTTSNDDLLALPSTLPHSVGGTIVLLVVLVLNVFKPRGMTRYGWRKEEQRSLFQQRQQEHERAVLRSDAQTKTQLEPRMDELPALRETQQDAAAGSDRGAVRPSRRWRFVLGVIVVIALLALIVLLHLSGDLGPRGH